LHTRAKPAITLAGPTISSTIDALSTSSARRRFPFPAEGLSSALAIVNLGTGDYATGDLSLFLANWV